MDAVKNRKFRKRYLKVFLIGLGGGMIVVLLLFWFEAYMNDRQSLYRYSRSIPLCLDCIDEAGLGEEQRERNMENEGTEFRDEAHDMSR